MAITWIMENIMLKIEITYCAVWHYTNRAVSLADELLKEYEHVIESVALIPSDEGRFEVNVNGQLVFSKLQLKRHAEAGEIVKIISKIVS